jgi:hypothetical protein
MLDIRQETGENRSRQQANGGRRPRLGGFLRQPIPETPRYREGGGATVWALTSLGIRFFMGAREVKTKRRCRMAEEGLGDYQIPRLLGRLLYLAAALGAKLSTGDIFALGWVLTTFSERMKTREEEKS